MRLFQKQMRLFQKQMMIFQQHMRLFQQLPSFKQVGSLWTFRQLGSWLKLRPPCWQLRHSKQLNLVKSFL
jgi:hypothetical protein